MKGIWQWLFLCAGMTIGGGPVSAHSMYQSAVLLDFRGNHVEAEVQLPADRLSVAFRRTVDESHFAGERSDLVSYVLAHVHPVAPDGRAFAVQMVSLKIETVEKAPYLVVHLIFNPPAGTKVDLFTLNYDVVTHEIVTHVVLVSIRSDSKAKTALNDPLPIGMLRGERKSIVVDRMSVL
jgi:hypothetical protein